MMSRTLSLALSASNLRVRGTVMCNRRYIIRRRIAGSRAHPIYRRVIHCDNIIASTRPWDIQSALWSVPVTPQSFCFYVQSGESVTLTRHRIHPRWSSRWLMPFVDG
jgi:hypothetical protein